jgi:DNA-directed RNA polymerase specialized sigma24 family protein
MDKSGKDAGFSWIRDSDTFLNVTGALNMEDDELDDVASSAANEFERRRPDFIKIAAIIALLPVIKRRSTGRFIAKWKLQKDVAEELASVVTEKIFEALFGRWPRGNVGAWSATISEHVGVDYLEKTCREREVFDWRVGVIESEAHADSTTGREAMARLLIELPSDARDVYDRLRRGDDWAIIEAETGLDEAGAARLFRQVIDWPESGSPRARKRSRRKRSS